MAKILILRHSPCKVFSPYVLQICNIGKITDNYVIGLISVTETVSEEIGHGVDKNREKILIPETLLRGQIWWTGIGTRSDTGNMTRSMLRKNTGRRF